MSDKAILIECLLEIERRARPVANGDTTSMPKLIKAIGKIDEERLRIMREDERFNSLPLVQEILRA